MLWQATCLPLPTSLLWPARPSSAGEQAGRPPHVSLVFGAIVGEQLPLLEDAEHPQRQREQGPVGIQQANRTPAWFVGMQALCYNLRRCGEVA